jgi:acetyl esterase/lipase
MILAPPIRLRITAVALVLLTLISACRITDMTLWKPIERPDGCEVERIRRVVYYDGPDADRLRHRLDVFLPKGKSGYPVVVLVHGGAWIVGDNRCCGLYSTVGVYLASQGIGVVMPNYRLSPAVQHPEHVKDVARAFAWTKQHIGEYGGRPDQIFVAGHSAGGHLVALLATDDSHLNALGCRIDDIRGVIGVSGVYRILDGKTEIRLGGNTDRALRLDEMIPLRGASTATNPDAHERPGLPVLMDPFHRPFGDDVQVRHAASPINHVRPGLPPFLLINAEKDVPLLAGMAVEMNEQLRKNGCESRHIVVPNRNHNSVMFQAIEPSDPVAQAMVDFVGRHARNNSNHESSKYENAK